MNAKSILNSFYYTLTKNDSNIIKAVAILLIVIHNYLNMTSFIGENEMSFDREVTMRFLSAVKGGFLDAVYAFFIYLGYFGVQLFVFISAYGLTKKSLSASGEPYFKYLFNRLIKIYALLIMGLMFLFVSKFSLLPLQEYIDVTVHFLTMTYTFNTSTTFIHVGPWWFFSLIVQLYILFPFLFYIIKRFGGRGVAVLLVVSYVLIFVLYYLEPQTSFPVFANAPGHLPEFILGICFAFFPRLKVNYKAVIPAAILFAGGCFFEQLYPFVFLSATIFLLAILKPLLRLSKEGIATKALIWIGQISMIMFVTNGIIREKTLKWAYRSDYSSSQLLADAFLHLALVIIVSYIIYLIYREVAKVIKKYTGIKIL